MKIHIVLKDPFTAEDIQTVKQAAEMNEINETRAARYGIITGESSVDIEEIKKLSMVRSVEYDGAKGIIHHMC